VNDHTRYFVLITSLVKFDTFLVCDGSLLDVSHWTDPKDSSCLSFFSSMSVLTLTLCARLSWLLVSF